MILYIFPRAVLARLALSQLPRARPSPSSFRSLFRSSRQRERALYRRFTARVLCGDFMITKTTFQRATSQDESIESDYYVGELIA